MTSFDPARFRLRRPLRLAASTALFGSAMLALAPVEAAAQNAEAALPFPVMAAGDMAAIDAALIGKAAVARAAPGGSDFVPLSPVMEARNDMIGPQMEEPTSLADDAPQSSVARRPYASFGEDVKAIKWEYAAVTAYYFAINSPKLFDDPRWPRSKDEGWFGINTNNMGVDKLAHAYSTYVVSEILHARLRRKTGGAPGIAVTSALLASSVMALSEASDSITPDGGWSWQDFTFNSLGAGFSVLRNSVPGLDRKLDFRLMWEANEDILTFRGKRHFQRQRYFLALKPSGFEALEKTPLRFVEFHLGYRANDFTNEDRAAGIRPKRHVFVGLGLNLRELLFKNPRTRAGRAAGEVLDYFQPPFTAIHHNITE